MFLNSSLASSHALGNSELNFSDIYYCIQSRQNVINRTPGIGYGKEEKF